MSALQIAHHSHPYMHRFVPQHVCSLGKTAVVAFCRFSTDPSGKYLRCKAHAIGSGSEGAETTLLEQYKSDMSYADAEKLALSTLKQVMEEKVCSPCLMLAIRISQPKLECPLTIACVCGCV